MAMSRRDFVASALAAAAAKGAAEPVIPAKGETQQSQPAPPEPLVAGDLEKFSADGVYADFRQQGFFVVRRGKRIIALSSVCTHKGCKVRVAEDESFFCKCHGSTFDRDGKVTKGPARRNLPRLAVRLDEQRQVLVDPSQQIENK